MTHRGLGAGISVLVAGLVLLATGCDMPDSDPDTSSTSAVEVRAQLNALPSLEETRTQVQAAIDEVTAAASAQVPGLTWQSIHGETRGNCEGPFEKTDGKRLFLPDAVASTQLSDPQWESILGVARQSAARLGATDEQVMQRRPGPPRCLVYRADRALHQDRLQRQSGRLRIHRLPTPRRKAIRDVAVESHESSCVVPVLDALVAELCWELCRSSYPSDRMRRESAR